MVGHDGIKVLLCGAILLGWTWPEDPGTLQLRGSVGFTTINFLTNVKGAGPTDPDSFSDLRMANGPAFQGGIQYFLKPWLSVGLDGQYAINALKQQAMLQTSVTTPPLSQMTITKGWNGKAITVAPSILLHSPEYLGVHLYGGGGPTFTMSTLCDGFGCTESNDWGIQARLGLQMTVTDRWRLFTEFQHKEDYLDCDDREGCFRGRRYGNAVLFGIAVNLP